ncbi:MAG: phosphate-starvation-inducible PsiE family protein [Actinomycetota bacterium]|nr:phosphate-starvation-inducible PsiE family protein [Actinomycetota bacterium]
MKTSTDHRERTEERRNRRDDREERTEEAADEAEHQQAVLARVTDRGLHMAEDFIYALTGMLLVAGAVVVLLQGVYKFSTTVSDGVLKAVEAAVGSLLIVFILVELLSAVRTIITQRKLVAEPFLIVGILAAIKEMVTLATFKIEEQSTTDVTIKIGVLAAVVIGLAVAILILRRTRSQHETKDQQEERAPA